LIRKGSWPDSAQQSSGISVAQGSSLFKTAVAAGLGGTVSVQVSAAEFPTDPFWNNVPDPELSKPEFSNFKFELE